MKGGDSFYFTDFLIGSSDGSTLCSLSGTEGDFEMEKGFIL
jgi:hypothetical protein